MEQAISKTSIANLNVLTCGPIPPNPSDLLDSKAMEQVMDELKQTYDYIIFDTPPILLVTDSQIIASKSDGVVMVVACGKTRRDRLIVAKELLEKTNTMILGAVVNGVVSKKNDYFGHYG